jgi:predicted nucleic acid-binding protein
MKAYFDTTVLVAASVASHPHHTQAVTAVRAVANKKVTGYVSGHGLCELYAVLTRTPFHPPVHPMEAWKIISENVLAHFEILTLSAGMYRAILQEYAEKGWIGGRIYDALHLRCAKKAACERIYTFDLKHFCELAPDLRNRICAP